MAGLLALAIVLLAAVQVHSQTDRADVNDVRLDDLYDRLQTVTKILDDRESSRKGKVKELIELDGRVRDLKGTSSTNSDSIASFSTTVLSQLMLCVGTLAML